VSVTGTGASSQAEQTANGIGAETPTNGFLWPNRPNIIDFWFWLQTNVSIPEAALPVTSPYPQYALWQALELVLCDRGVSSWATNPNGDNCIAPMPRNLWGGISYTLAVYNCATHLLLGIAPDQPGQNFFTAARANSGYSLVNPSTGLIVAASDVTTSSTLTPPKWASGLTVSQLGFMKTPYGREYLAYNQAYGPTIVGLT
jgi:hypothetical protein